MMDDTSWAGPPLTCDDIKERAVGILGEEYPYNPRRAGAWSHSPVRLPGDHYGTDLRNQLIPGCVCGHCDSLLEDVPGGLWCVRYPEGLPSEDFTKRRSRDIFTYHEKEVSGYVYLLEAGIYYKIGRTKTPDERIKALQIQLPFPAELKALLPCDNEAEAEKWFHWHHEERRTNGEWFKLTYGEANLWGSAWINGEMEY